MDVFGADVYPQQSGLFVFDITRLLLSSEIESYCIEPTIGGYASYLNYSEYNQRISYMDSYSQVYILPFPHRNTINLLGLGPKSEYLIWREKNGLFTALHKSGELRVWSICTGKLIYRQPQHVPIDLNQYRVYQAHESLTEQDDGDTSYIKNFYNRENDSIQLLIRKKPEDWDEEDHEKQVKQTEGIFLEKNEVIQKFGPFQLYNFLVLQLQTYEDNQHKKQGVKVVFQFKFFISDIEAERPLLHLSADNKKLMEIIKNQSAIVYQRENFKPDKKGKDSNDDSNKEENVKEITWIRKQRILQYPNLLQCDSAVPFLFDPQFKRYIDINYSEGCFVVRNVNQKKSTEIKIPHDLLSLTQNIEVPGGKICKIQSESCCQLIAKRIQFIEKDLIRYVNKEGIDMLYDIELMRVVAYCKRDNLTQDEAYFERQKHFLLEQGRLDDSEVFERLVRRCQESKVNMEFAKFYWNRAQVLKDQSYKRNQVSLLKHLYRIDYSQSWGGPESSFLAELSFTVLDWIIVQRITSTRQFNLGIIDRSQQIQLGFNIFPKNKTMLHILAEESRNTESKIERVDLPVQQLFQAFEQGLLEPLQESILDKATNIELPILEDLDGKTPIDEALGINQENDHTSIFHEHDRVIQKHCCNRLRKRKVCKRCGWWLVKLFNTLAGGLVKRVQNEISEQEGHYNLHMASLIFSKIKDYSFLHSGPLLSQSVSKAIRQKVIGIGDYLDSRLVKSMHCPFVSQPPIRTVFQYQNKEGAYANQVGVDGTGDDWVSTNYGTMNAQVWSSKSEITDSLFMNKGNEVPMLMYYLDVPSLHVNGSEGIRFLEALNDIQEEARFVELYKHRAVQVIVNEHWAHQRWIFYFCYFLPYLANLVLFTLWSNFILGEKGGNMLDSVAGPIQITQVVLCLYFLLIEVTQLSRGAKRYFLDYENYIQVIPLVFILINIWKARQDNVDVKFWHYQMIAALGMWYRSFYCLGSFQIFNYYIRMLFVVIKDMGPFLLLLAILVLGFADAMLSLSTSLLYLEQPKEPFINGGYTVALQWSYLSMLGSGAVDGFDGFSWWLFVGLSVLQVIIMLNFLVAIIGSTYERVDTNRIQFQYKAIVGLIIDIQVFPRAYNAIYGFISGSVKWVILKVKSIQCCKCKGLTQSLSQGSSKLAKWFRCRKSINQQKTGRTSKLGRIFSCGHARERILKYDLLEKQGNCELLFFASEDPENRDSIPDQFEEQEVADTDGQTINEVQQGLNELNEKLSVRLNQSNEQVEHQIDALNQVLKQEQEQLALLRKQFHEQLLEAEEDAAKALEMARTQHELQLEKAKAELGGDPSSRHQQFEDEDHHCEEKSAQKNIGAPKVTQGGGQIFDADINKHHVQDHSQLASKPHESKEATTIQQSELLLDNEIGVTQKKKLKKIKKIKQDDQ